MEKSEGMERFLTVPPAARGFRQILPVQESRRVPAEQELQRPSGEARGRHLIVGILGEDEGARAGGDPVPTAAVWPSNDGGSAKESNRHWSHLAQRRPDSCSAAPQEAGHRGGAPSSLSCCGL